MFTKKTYPLQYRLDRKIFFIYRQLSRNHIHQKYFSFLLQKYLWVCWLKTVWRYNSDNYSSGSRSGAGYEVSDQILHHHQGCPFLILFQMHRHQSTYSAPHSQQRIRKWLRGAAGKYSLLIGWHNYNWSLIGWHNSIFASDWLTQLYTDLWLVDCCRGRSLVRSWDQEPPCVNTVEQVNTWFWLVDTQ